MDDHFRKRVSQQAGPALVGPPAPLVALEEGQVAHRVGGNELVPAGREPRLAMDRRQVPALKYIWSST